MVYDADWVCRGVIKCKKGCSEPEPEPAEWVYYPDPKTGRVWGMHEFNIGSAVWTDFFQF